MWIGVGSWRIASFIIGTSFAPAAETMRLRATGVHVAAADPGARQVVPPA
jgi:hypothetical protein